MTWVLCRLGMIPSCLATIQYLSSNNTFIAGNHDDVIKWKHFPRYWPFVRGIHRSPVISPHKGQWRGALMFSLICVWINGWVNNREAGDLRRHRDHYDVIVMYCAGTTVCHSRCRHRKCMSLATKNSDVVNTVDSCWRRNCYRWLWAKERRKHQTTTRVETWVAT